MSGDIEHGHGGIGLARNASLLADRFRSEVATWARSVAGSQELSWLSDLLQANTDSEISPAEFARIVGECMACVSVGSGLPDETAWRSQGCEMLEPFAAHVVKQVVAKDGLGSSELLANDSDFFEHYLRDHLPQLRTEVGAFYTPSVLASSTVRRVHETLQHDFGLADGIADTASWRDVSERHPGMRIPMGVSPDQPFVTILEPAAGTGVFLIAVLDLIYETLVKRWRGEGRSAAQIDALWNEHVRQLLPRMVAVELMPAAGVLAQMSLVRRLHETGFRFRSTDRLRFFVANTLLDADEVCDQRVGSDERSRDEVARLHLALRETVYSVVIGNPPFRGISDNTTEWMQRLLRGTAPDGSAVASYYQVNGQSLGERKMWLQDDYVKFLRHAHWQIERTGAGVVGFVTNHGYLDNTTFRGVRHALQETFDKIDILDLHGNRKKREVNPAGGLDQSVFEVEQGVAVGVFARSPDRDARRLRYRDLWGSRADKLRQLADETGAGARELHPAAPHFLLVPATVSAVPEYQAGWPINEVMPVNSTAVVTARDRFVIASTEDELLERMKLFRDPAITDDEIRATFFTRGRSRKYLPGDTRGWRLAEARLRMMQDADWEGNLKRCSYRPFDDRVIYWTDWMVDWPRSDVMRHMTERDNIALITRRQVPTGAECNFFWITKSIAIDGLVRSDNRGSESVFPLFLADAPHVNLSHAFIVAGEDAGLKPRGRDDEAFAFDVLHYTHALFTSQLYRQRYASHLRHDFPRILLPNSKTLWRELTVLGEQLVAIQTTPQLAAGRGELITNIGRGFPQWTGGAISLGPQGPEIRASREVWDWRAGTYQVCRKWVRDRKALTQQDLARYEQIVGAIGEMLSLTAEVDRSIARAGGCASAFLA